MGNLLACGSLAMELCSRASGISDILDGWWVQLDALCNSIRLYCMRYNS